jgi:DNA-binding protein YbaB
MASYTVQIVLNVGISGLEYIFPHVFKLSDPQQGMKATVIEGTRGDGAIVIPGGKKSQEITIQGRLIDNDGYEDLTTLMTTMRNMVTTDQSTLTLQHWTGSTWQVDWEYTVRRISEIDFPESLRIWEQEYSIEFLVIAY